jgi:hypothetical protein
VRRTETPLIKSRNENDHDPYSLYLFLFIHLN